MPAIQAPHVHVLVPGLFGPRARGRVAPDAAATQALAAVVEGLDLGALQRALSRAACVPASCAGATLDEMLFAAFGLYGHDPAAGPPVAAVTRLADSGEALPGWHLRADPVHLHADMNDVVLQPAGAGTLAAEEARSLVAEINAALAPELQIEPVHPLRWYVRLDEPPMLRAAGLQEVAGGGLAGHLPAGEEGARWRRRLNEVQTVLHASTINAAREARGVPAVNGVWFWGAGALPSPPATRHVQVHGGGVLAAGLARLANCRHAALPGDAPAWLRQGRAPGGHLLVLDGGYGPAVRGEVEAWREWLRVAHARWLAPLVEATAAGRLAALTIEVGHHTARSFTRRSRLRVWRRTRPYASLVP